MPVIYNDREKLKRFLISIGVSLGIYAFALLISCVAAYLTEDPGKLQKPASIAALYIASFVAGVSTVRINRGSVACSVLTGAILTLILALISVCFFKGESDFLTSVLMHILVIGATALGGIVGKKRNAKTSLKRKKLKRRR